jgi:hypothetical protein
MKRRSIIPQQFVLGVAFVDLFAGLVLAMFVLLVAYIWMNKLPQRPKPVQFVESSLPPPAIPGSSYLYAFPVVDGAAGRRFTLSGELPDSLHFDTIAGALYGFVCQAAIGGRASYPFEVTVADSHSSDTLRTSVTLYPGAAPFDPEDPPFHILRSATLLPIGRTGEPYESVLGAEGGVQPYVWEVADGSLPPGLRLDRGRLLGTPSAPGDYSFIVSVKHSAGWLKLRSERSEHSASWLGGRVQLALRIRIIDGLLATAVFPPGEVGTPYEGGLVLENSSPEDRISWSGLPPWLSASSGGRVLRGEPSQEGTHQLSYRVTGASGALGGGVVQVRVFPRRPDFEIKSAVFQAWLGEDVDCELPYRGGRDPVQLRAEDPLPPGLRLEQGAIVGRAQQPVFAIIRVTGVDADGKRAAGRVSIRVGTRY